MRVDNNLPLSSILVFKKKIQTPHSLLNFILGWQSSSLRKFKPLPTSASRLAITPEDYSRRQSKVEKTIEGFDCKINGQAFLAALWHSFSRSDKTQGVSESAAVAASLYRLA